MGVSSRVWLVSPPWARLDVPSLACGSAKPYLEGLGHSAEAHWLNLEFASRIGAAAYEWVSEEVPFLGDALWADALRSKPSARKGWRSLLRRWLRRKSASPAHARRAMAQAARIRAEIGRFLEEWPGRSSAGPDLVVFVCDRDKLDQTMSSAALARALKAAFPSARAALWGPAVEEPSGSAYLEAFPWLDFRLEGDLEAALACLLARGAPAEGPPPLLRSLDELPVPDFEGFFEDLRRLRRGRGLLVPDVRVPFESSRGCWWGERSHCRFCNLSDSTIASRRKSVPRLVAELRAQSSRHRTLRFCAKDEMMPPAHLEPLCEALGGVDFSLYYEIKPFLGRAQIESLARAGIREVQPGLETFHSAILARMGKGARAIQNVLFLKWCTFYGLDVRWFFLHGLPGETAAECRDLVQAVPRLRHLAPPLAFRRLELLRHSPYFAQAGRFGLDRVRPCPEYEEVLPSAALDWGRAAQRFEYALERDPALESETARLAAEVSGWRSAWLTGRPPTLECRRGPGFLEIYDHRGPDWRRVVLEGARAWAYDFCGDQPRASEEVLRAAASAGWELSARAWEALAAELEERGLLWREGASSLGLALPYRRHARRHDLSRLYWGRTHQEENHEEGPAGREEGAAQEEEVPQA